MRITVHIRYSALKLNIALFKIIHHSVPRFQSRIKSDIKTTGDAQVTSKAPPTNTSNKVSLIGTLFLHTL